MTGARWVHDSGGGLCVARGWGVAPRALTPTPPPRAEGTEEPVKVRDAGDGVYECEYHPMVPGKYTVAITWGGYAIPRRSAGTPPTRGTTPPSPPRGA